MMKIGDLIDGKYRIIRLLGEGGMGSVYEAHHERLGQPVAIKELASNVDLDPSVIGRFEQEGRLQANLRHPSIVTVTDILVGAGYCALVMELVQGVTLAEVQAFAGAARARLVARVSKRARMKSLLNRYWER